MVHVTHVPAGDLRVSPGADGDDVVDVEEEKPVFPRVALLTRQQVLREPQRTLFRVAEVCEDRSEVNNVFLVGFVSNLSRLVNVVCV